MEEAIRKLNNFYEYSKCKSKPKCDLKGNDKFKGKWPPKWGRPQDTSEKENGAPYKKHNANEKGHGSWPGEKQNGGDGRGPLQCYICGKDNHKKEFPLYQGSRPQIYSAYEAQIVGDVGHNIPHIYVVLDKKQAYHHTSITEMEGKLYD